MKYNHMVKVNGKYYPSGNEIPEPDMVEECDSEVVDTETPAAEQSPKRGRKPKATE